MPKVINKQNYNQFLDSFKYHTDYSYFKNTDSVYLAVNDRTANLSGFKRHQDMLYKNDYELKCAAAEDAPLFQTRDRDTLLNRTDKNSICFNHFKDGWKLLLGNETVICDKTRRPIGILCHAQDITTFSILNVGVAFNQILHTKAKQQQSFLVELRDQYPQLNLTHRQSQCLFYYLHGYSAKETACIMKVTPNTIERHLENIKYKLSCRNKAQLFELAISLGLLNCFIN